MVKAPITLINLVEYSGEIYKLVISNIDNLITLNKINISINLCYQVLKDDVNYQQRISF